MMIGGQIGKTAHTIEDLITCVKARFAANATLRNVTVLDGHQNLQLEGAANRVVFVVGNGEIRFGAIRNEPGSFGTFTDVVNAHIWSAETGKDYGQDQCRAAKGIATEIAAAAYLEWGAMISGDAIDVAQNTHVLKYGETIVMTIRLKCPMYIVDQSVQRHHGGATTGV